MGAGPISSLSQSDVSAGSLTSPWSRVSESNGCLEGCSFAPGPPGSPHMLRDMTGTGGAESNSPSRVWSPRCSPEHAGKWLAAPGSNRARRVNSAVHSPRLLAAKTGAEDEDRTRIMSLEGSGPAIGRPPRRRGMESNHHPAFFKRVREPSLLPRQNWLRDQELHLATPAYEAGLTLGLPASEIW